MTPHRAYLFGLAHLSRLRNAPSLRLEAQGLFSKRVRSLSLGGLVPGVYWVRLWFRTDREGFVTQLWVVERRLLFGAPTPRMNRYQVPVGGVAGLPPLEFSLRGEWLGAHGGVGRVLIRPQDPLETPPFVVRFLLRRHHWAPKPGGVAVVRGHLERGRLVGEVLLDRV